MRPTLMLTVASVLALSVAPKLASANDIVLVMRGNQVINSDATYDVMSIDDATGYGNYALGYEVFENLRVYGEYWFGGEHDPLFHFNEFDFTVHGAVASVEYAYPLASFFSPHARAGVGFVWGDLDIDTDGVVYDDTDFGIRLYAVGGFDVLLPFGDPAEEEASFFDHVAIGLTADWGWSFGPWFTFDELAVEDAPEDAPVINLGEAALGGFTWNAGLTLRYDL